MRQNFPFIVSHLSHFGAGVVQATFTGKELDEESGLQYYGARYYDNQLGRFMSIDPVSINSVDDYLFDPQQLNSYSYGRNNPIVFLDKTGKKVSEFQPFWSSSNNYVYNTSEPVGEYKGNRAFSGGGATGTADNPNQCPDIVQRFSLSQYNTNLYGMGDASNYGNGVKLNDRLKINKSSGSYTVYENGGTVMPQENDIISWSGGSNGHVGLIVEVNFNNDIGEGYVYTLEQNVKSNQVLFEQKMIRNYNSNGEAVYFVESHLGSKYNVQAWARNNGQNDIGYSSNLYTPAPKSYRYPPS